MFKLMMIIGGIIAAIGAILTFGLELKIGLYVTIFGASVVITEFITDEWRRWRKKKEKKDEE